MKHIETIETRNLCDSAKNGGCGECQTSCQSACKTSCGIANQQCENKYFDFCDCLRRRGKLLLRFPPFPCITVSRASRCR